MTDIHSKEVRSYNMGRIRSKNTGPEMEVRRFLFSKGYRYKLHSKNLPGKPDITLVKYKTAIFVNGCFWHGHRDCALFTMPKSNTSYWKPKIEKNIQRDQIKQAELTKAGWKVIVIWECKLKRDTVQNTLGRLLKEIQNRN